VVTRQAGAQQRLSLHLDVQRRQEILRAGDGGSHRYPSQGPFGVENQRLAQKLELAGADRRAAAERARLLLLR